MGEVYMMRVGGMTQATGEPRIALLPSVYSSHANSN